MKHKTLKTRRYTPLILILIYLFFFLPVSTNHLMGNCNAEESQAEKDIIFQYSTINALMVGLYDGDISIGKLRQYGTIGLGTFNTLDGEMVVLDGDVYKIKADGNATPVPDNEKAPFAVLAAFTADFSYQLEKTMTFEDLQQYLDRLLPSKNIFYAIRIAGTFDSVKTRSVPSQEKPYPPLAGVIKNQPTFLYKDQEGYLVGFWFPFYMKDINIPGYHFHYISKDKKQGGHLLECRVSQIKIEIDYIYGVKMILPGSADFLKTGLQVEKVSQLE